jgi:hypothetical protein
MIPLGDAAGLSVQDFGLKRREVKQKNVPENS